MSKRREVYISPLPLVCSHSTKTLLCIQKRSHLSNNCDPHFLSTNTGTSPVHSLKPESVCKKKSHSLYQLSRGFGQVTKCLSPHSNSWPQPCIQHRNKLKHQQVLGSTLSRSSIPTEASPPAFPRTFTVSPPHLPAWGSSASPCLKEQVQGRMGSAALGNPTYRVCRNWAQCATAQPNTSQNESSAEGYLLYVRACWGEGFYLFGL